MIGFLSAFLLARPFVRFIPLSRRYSFGKGNVDTIVLLRILWCFTAALGQFKIKALRT